MKKTYNHFDKLGRELAVGDVVVFNSFYTGLTIGRIEALKKVRSSIQSFKDSKMSWIPSGTEDINSGETVKLDPRDVTFYLLKNK